MSKEIPDSEQYRQCRTLMLNVEALEEQRTELRQRMDICAKEYITTIKKLNEGLKLLSQEEHAVFVKVSGYVEIPNYEV